MNVSELLTEAFGRLPDLVRSAVEGLTPEQLGTAPAEGTNTVAWLVWHLTRIQDHHLAGVTGADQVYVTGDIAQRFGLKPDPEDHGYGHTAAQVLSVRPESAAVLVEYYQAVHERTLAYLGGLTAGELDRVVDESWDPPVTLGVRLVSVLTDDLQHVGQAAYVRGLLQN
ncbi:DinB family protein [Actinoplanes sp. NPDC049599]|uniref:mycothiol transferase n=1 Tax=Actinoplanes sp. NPDC049599 TaxID=3363903 RepID=UPI0037A52976